MYDVCSILYNVYTNTSYVSIQNLENINRFKCFSYIIIADWSTKVSNLRTTKIEITSTVGIIENLAKSKLSDCKLSDCHTI